ncbi:MAG: TonB-dependent receptor [Candidatus Azobacteroides sp.]|nr:TonB-dependent receptor [Candidatus Azobacteroides sp.]
MKKYLIPIVFVFLFCFPVLSVAQGEISGTVTDTSGEPVVGATVAVKGTTVGTVTDINGKFSLKMPGNAGVLVFSYLGLQTQEVAVKENRTVYHIVMEDNQVLMDEVVVIGYGTVAKKDLTGAVSSMRGKSITSIPITNTETALTGRMAGVTVTTSDGAPDAEVQIRVRGGGSITQDNSPLFIVDGFPVERISDIAPSDIESIDVLKDASASAIYGARGANGVVIVTTKSAKAGKTIVSYNVYGQWKQITKKYSVLDSYEFVKLQYELNDLKFNHVIDAFIDTFGDPEDFDIYKNIPGRDSQEEMYGKDVYGQSHNLSVSGGTEKTKFTTGLTYLKEEGILRNSSFERLNANFKLNHQLFETLKLDLSVYYSNATTMGAGTSANTSTEIRNAVSFRPVTGKDSRNANNILFNPDLYDDLEGQGDLFDPIVLIDQDYKKQNREEVNVNAAVTWDIIKNLSFKSEYGLLKSHRETDRFYGPITTMARTVGSNLPIAKITEEERPRRRMTHTLNYKLKNFKKQHDINALLGFEVFSQSQSERNNTSRLFPADITPEDAFARMQLGSPEYVEVFSEPDYRLVSFFGRANYSFRDKYLVSFTARADGSSKFAPGRRWSVFPSGAVAWRLSQENFLKETEQIDDLKLRLSYGEAGNDRIDNDMWRINYIGTIDKPVVGIGNTPNLYYKKASSVMTNPDLRWETTVTRNAGSDFSFFKSRLSGTLDFYYNTTVDLLLQSIVPEQTGYSYQQQNIGQTSNRGFEITLNAPLIQKKDFTLSASFNFAVNRNRVGKLNDGNSSFYRSDWADGLRETDDFILKVGEPVGLMYGYVTDGFYTVDDFVINTGGKWELKPGVPNATQITNPYWIGNEAAGMPTVGTLKLKKTTSYNPDDPASCVVTPDDRQVIGNAQPKNTGGFSFTSTYKNIDLSLYFNWVYGNDIYNANKILFTTLWKKNYYNMLDIVDADNRFVYTDDAGKRITDMEQLREMNKNAVIWNPNMKNPVFHSWAVEDGSFLRLNNVIVGYSLPKNWITKVRLSQCRFYLNVNNVFVWTKYTGFDPEVNTRTQTPLTPGVDYSSYPKARSFTLGANITFE